MFNKALFLAVCISLTLTGCASTIERESTVCGVVKERLVFWLWSRSTPDPDESRATSIEHVEHTEFLTSDNKKLNGYVYRSHDNSGNQVPAKGYILVALGNAMIADHMVKYLVSFAAKGYDVYLYDYRGYGSSEGKRRINAIIEDYKEIIASLNEQYDRRLLYGISIGGAVMLNAIGSGAIYDAAVIDSSPSRFSPFGCPKKIDPVNHLPDDSTNLLVITGQLDQVLGPSMTSELRVSAENKNAKVFDGKTYAHPFMDSSFEIHLERMAMIIEFLDSPSSNNLSIKK